MTRDRAWWWTVPLTLGLGLLSGWLSNSGYDNAWFAALRKPAFMPPAWAFPVVWTALYILMGVALAWVWQARGPARGVALRLFGLQLALNLAWSPLFFRLHAVRSALALIVLLTLLVAATVIVFARVRRPAGVLLLPYLAWLMLATVLNAAILALNPG